MSTKQVQGWRGWGILAMVGVMLVTAGCDPWDFGINDPFLYVAFGDSITSGNDDDRAVYSEYLSAMLGRPVINEGYDGMTSEFGRFVAEYVIEDHRPGFLLILFGVNDIISRNEKEDAVRNLRRIAQEAVERRTVPVIATLTPTFGKRGAWMQPTVRQLNMMIREAAREEGAFIVDLEAAIGWGPDAEAMFPDGVHPNEAGAYAIAQAFYASLQRIELIVR